MQVKSAHCQTWIVRRACLHQKQFRRSFFSRLKIDFCRKADFSRQKIDIRFAALANQSRRIKVDYLAVQQSLELQIQALLISEQYAYLACDLEYFSSA